MIASAEPRPDGARPGTLNPFGLGIPFLLLGVLLLPLFGLVGLAISAVGAFMCVVGVAMAITRSRKKPPPDEG